MEALSKLFDGLEGLQLVIPSKSALDPGWVLSKNPHQESISQDLTDWINKWYKEEKIRKKIAYAGVAMFSSTAYPRASFDALLAIAKWMAWLLPWDDAIDDDANSSIHPEDLIRYRDDTTIFWQSSMCAGSQEETKRHLDPKIGSIRDVAMAIRSIGDIESNQEFADEMCIWITAVTQSHTERQGDTPVIIQEFFQRRGENVCVHPMMALIDHSDKTRLPPRYTPRNNSYMQIIWTEVPIMMAMLNDLVSLQKELKDGVFESLVPLLMYHEQLGPQAAIERAKEMIHESYERFRQAEQGLYDQTDAKDLPVIKAYLLGCKNIIMANLNWSFSIKRYMGLSSVQADGSMAFQVSLPRKNLP